MNDDDLELIFERTKPDLPDEPSFHREVWKKIERRGELMSFSSLLCSAGDFLTKPAVGLPLACAVVAISAGLAVQNGMASRDQTWTELSLSYAQFINPRHDDELTR